MIITDTNQILRFLRGEAPDYKDRYYSQILAFSDKELELCHDQIQWIFPLHEESNFASTYPVINKEVVREADKDPEILYNLKVARIRMEKFLGLGEFHDIDKQKEWCNNHNHNLLRITRIIRSLRIFGLEDDSYSFYQKACYVAKRRNIESNTLLYWNKSYYECIFDSLK